MVFTVQPNEGAAVKIKSVVRLVLKLTCQIWIKGAHHFILWWGQKKAAGRISKQSGELHFGHQSFVLMIFQEKIYLEHSSQIYRILLFFGLERMLWHPIFNHSPFARHTKASLELASSLWNAHCIVLSDGWFLDQWDCSQFQFTSLGIFSLWFSVMKCNLIFLEGYQAGKLASQLCYCYPVTVATSAHENHSGDIIVYGMHGFLIFSSTDIAPWHPIILNTIKIRLSWNEVVESFSFHISKGVIAKRILKGYC